MHILANILGTISKKETYYFENVYKPKYYKDVYKLESNTDIIFNVDDFIKFGKKNYKRRYYMYYNIDIDDVDDACKQYFIGLQWILGYYNNHRHKNYCWYYPYSNTPFASDLYKYISNNIDFSYEFEESSPSSPIEQLSYVLPPETYKAYNIPEKIQRFYKAKNKKPIILDISNKEYLWQSILIE